MAWNDSKIKKRFSFICPMQWDEMEKTDNPQQRFCHSCKKNVTEVNNVDDFNDLAAQGACVSLLMSSGENLVSAPQPPEPERLGGAPRPPPQKRDQPEPPPPVDPAERVAFAGERLTGAARRPWPAYIFLLLIVAAIAWVIYYFFVQNA